MDDERQNIANATQKTEICNMKQNIEHRKRKPHKLEDRARKLYGRTQTTKHVPWKHVKHQHAM